jgi:hypothetical protein
LDAPRNSTFFRPLAGLEAGPCACNMGVLTGLLAISVNHGGLAKPDSLPMPGFSCP